MTRSHSFHSYETLTNSIGDSGEVVLGHMEVLQVDKVLDGWWQELKFVLCDVSRHKAVQLSDLLGEFPQLIAVEP